MLDKAIKAAFLLAIASAIALLAAVAWGMAHPEFGYSPAPLFYSSIGG